MQNNNQNQDKLYKIYLPHEKQWVEVPEAQYYAYYRDIWATRKRAQEHHQCMCPKQSASRSRGEISKTGCASFSVAVMFFESRRRIAKD